MARLTEYERSASFPEPKDPTDGPVFRFNLGRPAPAGTMFQSPIEQMTFPRLANEGGVSRGYGPATSVAVANTTAQEESPRPNYPTEYRAGYDAGASTAMRSVAVPRRSMDPYPGAPHASGPQAVPFPNITFNAPPPAVAAAANGGEGLGMISPRMEAQLYDLESEARPLLSSAGIVDRLRGRQLLRARDRLLAGAATLANARTAGVNAESGRLGARASMLGAQTGAFRASNEVPLALLTSATQRYGTDVGARTAAERDQTLRDINSENVAERRYATNMGLLPRMEDVARGEAVYSSLHAGDIEGAERAGQIGKFPPVDRNPNMQILPDGRIVFVRPGDALPRIIDPKDLDERTKAARAALVKAAE